MAAKATIPNGAANGHSTTDNEDAAKPLIQSPDSTAAPVPLPRNRTTLQLLVALALDGVEAVLCFLAREDPKDNKFLQGNWASVAEAPAVDTRLKVTGTIPDYLRGEFFRVGPNPKFTPTTGYHLFDGDGMLHAVKFSSGGAVSYFNKIVNTNKLKQEEAYGRPMFVKVGAMKGVVGLLQLMLFHARVYFGLLDLSQGAGTANTAVVYHAGTVQALHEGDMPYVVRVLADGELENVGRHSYGGALDHNLTAHPKADPVTGELYTFCYSVMKAPYVLYRVISSSGKLGPKVPITIPEPVMMHDFAITDNYAIFLDLPLVFDPSAMVTKGTIPFAWKQRPARFGILPRNDTSEANIRWFQRPPLFIFHVANAWEEGDEVVLFACRFDRFNMSAVEDVPSMLTEFRFNLKTGDSTERQMSEIWCDFPRINESFVGRSCRYVYAAVLDSTDIVGIVKFDLSRERKLLGRTLPTMAETAEAACKAGGCPVGFFDLGPGRKGSEPVFVPRPGASRATAEDDGCLLTMVYDSYANMSSVLVLDARSMSPVPLAVVHLNCRVPYGFHGTFVSEEQLEQQPKN